MHTYIHTYMYNYLKHKKQETTTALELTEEI